MIITYNSLISKKGKKVVVYTILILCYNSGQLFKT